MSCVEGLVNYCETVAPILTDSQKTLADGVNKYVVNPDSVNNGTLIVLDAPACVAVNLVVDVSNRSTSGDLAGPVVGTATVEIVPAYIPVMASSPSQTVHFNVAENASTVNRKYGSAFTALVADLDAGSYVVRGVVNASISVDGIAYLESARVNIQVFYDAV